MAARTLAWALSLLSSTAALADAASIPFGETVEVFGGMSRTDNLFEDGMTMTLYSPKGRTVMVSQNKSPLPGNLVAGFDDLSFVGIGRYSYAVRTNESAADMVARITLPYDVASLSAQRVEQAGLYVGKLAEDGRSWVVNPMENFGQLAGMGSLSGEYRLLGRKMTEQAELRRRGVNDISDAYQDLFARTYGPGAGGPPPGPPAGHGPGPAPGMGPLEVAAPGGPGPVGPEAACAPCSCAPAAPPPPPVPGPAPPPPPDALSPVPPAGSAPPPPPPVGGGAPPPPPPPPDGGVPPPPPADGGVPPPPPVPTDGTIPPPPGGPAGPSGSPPPPPAGGVPPPAGTLPPPSGVATPPPGGLGPTVSTTPINSASPAIATTAAAPDLRPGVAVIMGSLGLVMVAHALF